VPFPPLTPGEVLDLIPQKPPFRFVDRIVELDADRIAGEYTFRPDELFYPGHFPGFPVTPGVILLETMGQTAFALAIYLMALEIPVEDTRKLVTMTTEYEAEHLRIVRPGDSVRSIATKVFWRKRKLKAAVEMQLLDGTPVARAVIGGVGVAREL
jgi:3-hydroxyacyl-[acyl-carrier-protein] dehydratase